MIFSKRYNFIGSVFRLWEVLTHWGRMTHICVSKLTIIGSDNGLSPDRHQAIIWTNAWLLLIGPLGTNFSEILIEILTFWFKKMRLKVSSAKRRPFCIGFNVLMSICNVTNENMIKSDLNILLGLHNFSLQATIDHHGLFSVILCYTTIVNYCGKSVLLQRWANN